MSLVVIVPGRGLVRWAHGGARRSIAFRARDGGRFRNDVDRAAALARTTSPKDVALKIVESFPTAEIRE